VPVGRQGVAGDGDGSNRSTSTQTARPLDAMQNPFGLLG
jgi:hypothetical protein